MKANYSKAVLSLLLLFTAAFAQATPTTTTDGWAAVWQWLFPATSQLKEQAVCHRFPHCLDPPLAPEQQPEKPAGQQ